MPLQLRVRGVDEDVRVDDHHALSPFHGLVEGVPVRDVDQRAAAVERRQGGSLAGFFRVWKRPRSAVSTSSDIVRPCRAASRLSSAMTVSSILSVVFIWKTISHGWRYGQPRWRWR